MNKVFKKIYKKSYTKVLPFVKKLARGGGGSPEDYAVYREGAIEGGIDLSQFDVNNDGVIDDKDMNIIRKRIKK